MFRKLLVHDFNRCCINKWMRFRLLSDKAEIDRNVGSLENENDATTSQTRADDFFGILENGSKKTQDLRFANSDNATTGNTTSSSNNDEIQVTGDQNIVLESLFQKRTEPGLEKVLDVRFGYLRRDADNPRRSKHAKSTRVSHRSRLRQEGNASVIGKDDQSQPHAFLLKFMSPHETITNRTKTRQVNHDITEPMDNMDRHTIRSAYNVPNSMANSNDVSVVPQVLSSDPSLTVPGSPVEQAELEGFGTSSYFDEQYFGRDKSTPENQNTEPLRDNIKKRRSTDGDWNYIEGQYFGDDPEKIITPKADLPPTTETNSVIEMLVDTGNKIQTDKGCIEEQYFGQYQTTQNRGYYELGSVQIHTPLSDSHPTKLLTRESQVNNLSHQSSVFAKEFVSKDLDDIICTATPDSYDVISDGNSRNQSVYDNRGTVDFSAQETFMTDEYETTSSESRDRISSKNKSKERFAGKLATGQDNTHDVHIVEPGTRQARRLRETQKPNLTEPTTAYDAVMKIRLEKQGRLTQTPSKHKGGDGHMVCSSGTKLDSKGFRILKDQVPDWSRTPKEVLAKVLKDSIIYNNDDIVVIDKPYGIPSHGGPGVAVSVGQLLPLLAPLLDQTGNLKMLHLIHRLDKETTGVMILAKTAKVAWRLHGMFQRREVTKKYWLLTKGVPDPTKGIIDIPMAESSINSIHKMTVQPEYNEQTKHVVRKSSLKTSEALTHFRVLDSHGNCALVECQPETGVKHQIRAHMAYGLNTPVLGDHKYSHYAKLAPQKLYPDLLQRLGIRQSKVRHLAMHLHAKVLVLPEFLDGRNLFLTARLPGHFMVNMKRLKLKPPK